MKNVSQMVLILTLFLSVGCRSIASDPLFKLTLKAVDDEGHTIEGAKAGFGGERRPKHQDETSRGVWIEGVTDAQGLFSGEMEVWNATQSGYTVEKSGYYPVTQHSYSAKSVVHGKWQPWNPTIEVVLKRIKNPAPMFAKRVEGKLPAFGVPVAYDFQAGDWVAPHGKGKIADMIFVGTIDMRGDRDFDYTLKVSFSNPGDGIQRFMPEPEPSAFPSPYEAPAAGYLQEWNLKRSRHGPTEREQDTFNSKGGYFFRVRTVLDRNGNVMKALYGKIYGDFFDMSYRFNPDGTRNMEYDPKKNLLEPPTNWDRRYYEVGP